VNKLIKYTNYRSKSFDILHILSPFEHQCNAVIPDRVSSSKVVVTIYDFISFIFKESYLSSAMSRMLYSKRLRILQSADLILSISEFTRRNAIALFNIPSDKIVNIGMAASDDFYKIDDVVSCSDVKKKHGIDGKFVLTVSNLDKRKNLICLLSAFSALPEQMLKEYSLVVVCNSPLHLIQANSEINKLINQKNVNIKFLYFISDQDLNALYNACHLFVYASLYEGGGLPVIEAMKCGAPVIASNIPSISEFAGRSDILFDPNNMDDILHAILNVLTDEDFRVEIKNYGQIHSKNLSWKNVVRKAMESYECILSS